MMGEAAGSKPPGTTRCQPMSSPLSDELNQQNITQNLKLHYRLATGTNTGGLDAFANSSVE